MIDSYNKVTAAIIEELKAIVGSAGIIANDQALMTPYSHDEVADPVYANMPEVVVKPANTFEVSAVVALANRERIPITPRGAGSGLSGGAVPLFGGIVLSTEKMNRIIEVDCHNMIAVLEPGVVTNDFNRVVEQKGLFFAGYPMSLEMCYIGGNVAENAGGGRALKYGVTGRYITGLEVVMPTGEICLFGGKRVKDVTGYNMVQLMVGSEGTLGVFTKIYVRLLPLPAAMVDMMVLFPTVQAAIDAVPLIITGAKILPTGIEFMDKLSLDTTSEYLGEKKRYADSGAILIIEVDGNDADHVREECLAIGELCLDHGALDAYIAEGPADREKIWKVRKHVAEAFKAISPVQSIEDIVVPLAGIPELVARLELLQAKYNVIIPCYGHAGDGNLHATVVKDPEASMESWHVTLPLVLSELYREVKLLGGTISGEHGIGHKRKKYMPLVLSEAEIAAMQSIKRALDPHNILNPGKIF
jgi:glycolate oxidase